MSEEAENEQLTIRIKDGVSPIFERHVVWAGGATKWFGGRYELEGSGCDAYSWRDVLVF